MPYENNNNTTATSWLQQVILDITPGRPAIDSIRQDKHFCSFQYSTLHTHTYAQFYRLETFPEFFQND